MIKIIKEKRGDCILKLYKKLFAYMPEKKFQGFLSVILTTASNLMQFYAYFLIWKLLKDIFLGNSLDESIKLAPAILILFILQGLVYLLGLWISHLAGFRLETRLRERGIENLLRASSTFFDTHESGEVRKIIDNNVEQTHMIVAHLIPDQTSAILMPILMLILVFNLDLYLGIFFLIIVFLSLFIMKKMMGDTSFMGEYMKMGDQLNAGAVEYVSAMPVVKIFNAPIIGFKKLYENIIGYRDMVYKYSMSCRIPYVSFQWLLNIFIVAPVFLAIFMVSRGENPGLWSAKILFFTLFMGLFFTDLMKIMYVGMYVYQANSAVDNLEKLFTEMSERKTIFGSDTSMDNTDIEFNNVSFSYEEDKKILDDFSLKLEGNKVYALIGSSGSGKSTIAKLITGLYPIDSGQIKIGGKDISSYEQNYLMNSIGIVFQNPKLFKGLSIFDNVKLAKKDASDKEVLKALELARCNEFIDKFKDGYKTIIGAEGINLSGGENQRISIARIFLKNPKIIILDEASAAADPENEYELQVAFKNLIKDRTVIMIAHRLSSIRGAYEILVVLDGKIIERGSHQNLMNKDSRYKKFVNLYEMANDWRVV